MRRRMTRSTGAVSGLLIILLGVWGALIPFVGPYFDYSFSTNTTWHYTTDRLWLDILPGALAVLAGVLLLLAATRAAGILAGWLAIVAGAWFVVGPSVSLTWESGVGPIGRPLYGSTRQMLELVGYFYGLGALIVALAAFAVGRFASRPALAEEAATAGPVGRTEPAPPATPRTAGAEEGRRRRLPLPRRRERSEGDRPGNQLGRRSGE
jgi:peptidoglycan/LPS O-acetylase OafA/YrhL